MAVLKTNYKDDVLDTSVNDKRKYQMIQNADGTISLTDATSYTQEGSTFGAADINATNQEVNTLNENLGGLTSVHFEIIDNVLYATYNGVKRTISNFNKDIPLIPLLTTDDPKVFASNVSVWNGFAHSAYKAFNGYGGGELDSWGVTSGDPNQYVGYDFEETVYVTKMTYKNYFKSNKSGNAYFELYNIKDNIWEIIHRVPLTNLSDIGEEYVVNVPDEKQTVPYSKFRFRVDGYLSTESGYVIVDSLQVYGYKSY